MINIYTKQRLYISRPDQIRGHFKYINNYIVSINYHQCLYTSYGSFTGGVIVNKYFISLQLHYSFIIMYLLMCHFLSIDQPIQFSN